MMTDTTATSNAPSLVVRRVFGATREQLFDAWTQPEQLQRFVRPSDGRSSNIHVDLRVGGRYTLTMHLADGEELVVGGVYREVDRPSRLVCTWRWAEDSPELEYDSLLTLDFLEHHDGTEIVLKHEQFLTEESRDRHIEGWTKILEQLGNL